MSLPKILIFTPIYEKKDYCLDMFIKHAIEIKYPNKKHIFIDNSETDEYYKKLQQKLPKYGFEVYRVSRGNNTRESLSKAQNLARTKALNEGYDLLLSLESDIMIKPDTVTKLFLSGKRVISALYFIGVDVKVPCLTLPEYNKQLHAFGTRLIRFEEKEQYISNGIQQVGAAGMGCCLINRDVFEKFTFGYDPRFQGHSDIHFFNDCFNNQIPVFVDTDLILDHDSSDWRLVEDI